MRDIVVTLIVFGSLPFIVHRPVNGVFMWVWLSVMQPHLLAWGFASAFPFPFIIALCTTFSMLLSRVPRTLTLAPPLLALLAFAAWLNIALPFALSPHGSLRAWSKVMEVVIMTMVCTMLLASRRDIERLIAVLAASLGFYGVVGGIDILRGVGAQHTWAPAGTIIGASNAIALALIMTIPLMAYLYRTAASIWLRRALAAAMVLCGLAAIGSSSRGGLLAIGAIAAYFWLQRGLRPRLGALLVLTTPLLVLLVPGQQPDAAVHGRLDAWRAAWHLARSHFFGGGFDLPPAHSIYFQLMGEHGFVGLGLYLLLGWLTWRSASHIAELARTRPELDWAAHLAVMVQASLAGFAVGGAFVNLGYFDLPFYLMGVVVATRVLVEQQVEQVKGIPCKSPFPS